MLTAIGDVMRKCHENGWITTRDGNISLKRNNSKTLYITPSGWRKSIIHPEHVVKCKMQSSGLVVPEGVNPSGELEMHYLLQKDVKNTRAVVHVHATNIVAAMFAGWNLQSIAQQFPEIYRYTRVGPSVVVLPATSKDLAIATARAIDISLSGDISFDIVGQANHGVCAIGPDPWGAYEHIERLEHICEIVLKSGVKVDVERL
jgi:ribulose-5-phosphate 4-epimerase/fuculose-1-phosphate aldolase